MDAILPVLLFVAIAAAVSVGLVVVTDLIGGNHQILFNQLRRYL